jgi:hypothetical protein
MRQIERIARTEPARLTLPGSRPSEAPAALEDDNAPSLFPWVRPDSPQGYLQEVDVKELDCEIEGTLHQQRFSRGANSTSKLLHVTFLVNGRAPGQAVTCQAHVHDILQTGHTC